jgi:hypothetical protein
MLLIDTNVVGDFYYDIWVSNFRKARYDNATTEAISDGWNRLACTKHEPLYAASLLSSLGAFLGVLCFARSSS